MHQCRATASSHCCWPRSACSRAVVHLQKDTQHWNVEEAPRCLKGINWPPCVNSPSSASPHMGWPAKMRLTGGGEGQGGMWEFCNLDIPAGSLASDNWFLESAVTTLWRTGHFSWPRSSLLLLSPPTPLWVLLQTLPWTCSDWTNTQHNDTPYAYAIYCSLQELAQLGDWLRFSCAYRAKKWEQQFLSGINFLQCVECVYRDTLYSPRNQTRLESDFQLAHLQFVPESVKLFL